MRASPGHGSLAMLGGLALATRIEHRAIPEEVHE
jgi:hypothetical protein